jgi:cytochrome c oxidase subunit 2
MLLLLDFSWTKAHDLNLSDPVSIPAMDLPHRRNDMLLSRLPLGLLAVALISCAREAPELPLVETPVEEEAEFEPGVRQVGEGRYEVNLVAYQWGYQPRDIRVPVGAEVTIRGMSADVPHGFYIGGTGVGLMLQPDTIQELTHTFTEPGQYQFVCDNYCGTGHAEMLSKITVE